MLQTRQDYCGGEYYLADCGIKLTQARWSNARIIKAPRIDVQYIARMYLAGRNNTAHDFFILGFLCGPPIFG